MSFEKRLLMLSMIIFITLFTTNKIFAQEEVFINTDHLNVRTGPSTDDEIITQVHTGEIYSIIKEQNNWIEIQLPKETGWITTDYITIIDQENKTKDFTTVTSTPNIEREEEIIITNDNTHIRSGPSVNENIINYVNKGETLPLVSEDEEWYKVEYEEKTGYVFKALIDNKFSFANNLRNKTIVIDAGHGGRDTGATGAAGSYEKDISFMTTKKLKKTLTIFGAEVLLTRKNDEYTRLGSRPVLANVHDTDAFISIHYNSFPESPSVTGIGTYYYDDYNKSLANSIQKELIVSTDAKDRDITFGNFLVLRQNYTPSVLVELGFISNYEKEQLLLTNSYQKQLVNGMVTGLTSYFLNN